MYNDPIDSRQKPPAGEGQREIGRGERYMMEQMSAIKELVTLLGGNRARHCYYVLCCAIYVALKHYPDEPRMRDICAEAAALFCLNADALPKALSRAVIDIWETGDRSALEKLFRRCLVERPTPKCVVLVAAQYLKQEEMRSA